MAFEDNYGEMQAYRAGLGDSYYPPNEDEEENDMAIKEAGDAIPSQNK